MKKEINGIDDIIKVQMNLLFDSIAEHYKIKSGDINKYWNNPKSLDLKARLELVEDSLFVIILDFVTLIQEKQ